MTQDRRHEKIIADRFIAQYDPEFQFSRLGNDAGEPDVLYEKNGEVLGVEVTTAYYQDAQDEKNAGSVHNPDAVLCDIVQPRIDGKLQKTYHGSPQVILCIEVQDPIADKRLMEKCINQLFVPPQKLFSEIYLLHKSPKYEGGQDILYAVP